MLLVVNFTNNWPGGPPVEHTRAAQCGLGVVVFAANATHPNRPNS